MEKENIRLRKHTSEFLWILSSISVAREGKIEIEEFYLYQFLFCLAFIFKE